jgi:hypothetical protein
MAQRKGQLTSNTFQAIDIVVLDRVMDKLMTLSARLKSAESARQRLRGVTGKTLF